MARRLRLDRRIRAGFLLLWLTLFGCAPAEAEPAPTDSASPAEADIDLPARVEAKGEVVVRANPDKASRRLGVLIDCAVVEIDRVEPGSGCDRQWGHIPGGWLCLDHTVPSAGPLPTSHPLLAFDHPTPEERAEYGTTGTFDRATGPAAEALLPFVYGRRIGRFEGRCWGDIESAKRGDKPVKRLDATRRQHFVEVIETEQGDFLKREDGSVVPVDDVFLYAPSRFGGIDLEELGGPADTLPGWVRRGTGRLRSEASIRSEILTDLPSRTPLMLGEPAPSTDGHTWLPVREGAEHPAGYIAASRVRRVRILDPPGDIGPSDVWIDIDLSQQVLTVLRGTSPIYATMVSTGVGEHKTPLGLFRIKDKMLHWDMASRTGSDDPYHLEEVPWVLHFWPRYALHGAFWHDGFGEPRSHGCINLAPRDARAVFDLTTPVVPPGWHTAWESADQPGTALRIRRDSTAVPERRRPLN